MHVCNLSTLTLCEVIIVYQVVFKCVCMVFVTLQFCMCLSLSAICTFLSFHNCMRSTIEIMLQISYLILQCMGEHVNGTTSNLFSGGYTCYSYTVVFLTWYGDIHSGCSPGIFHLTCKDAT